MFCMHAEHNDTIKTSDTVLRKIYLSLYLKGLCVRGSWIRTELQHIDPHSIGHNRVSLLFSWAAQPGSWGPNLSGCWFSLPHLISNSLDPQLIWSPNWLIWGPEGSLCWMLAFSTASYLQLIEFPVYWVI